MSYMDLFVLGGAVLVIVIVILIGINYNIESGIGVGTVQEFRMDSCKFVCDPALRNVAVAMDTSPYWVVVKVNGYKRTVECGAEQWRTLNIGDKVDVVKYGNWFNKRLIVK